MIKCKILGHKWNMYAGFDHKRRVHHTAYCLTCGVKYAELSD